MTKSTWTITVDPDTRIDPNRWFDLKPCHSDEEVESVAQSLDEQADHPDYCDPEGDAVIMEILADEYWRRRIRPVYLQQGELGNCSLAIRVELRLGEFGVIHCGSNVFQHEHIPQALQFIDALESQDLEYSEYWMAIAEHSQPLPPAPTFEGFYQYVLQRCQLAIEDYHEYLSFYVTDRSGYLEIVHGRKPRSLEGKFVWARFEASAFPSDCKLCIKPQKEGFETPEEEQRGIEDYARQVARHLFDGFQFIQRRRIDRGMHSQSVQSHAKRQSAAPDPIPQPQQRVEEPIFDHLAQIITAFGSPMEDAEGGTLYDDGTYLFMKGEYEINVARCADHDLLNHIYRNARFFSHQDIRGVGHNYFFDHTTAEDRAYFTRLAESIADRAQKDAEPELNPAV
ncbi:hypothetical protein [Acaryochloris sp. CCMEE 5410]|uniref:hypothetical protein n=1 Tax=Acaryochloris sp. CCMEE 5410 TaxID=310037 RepID=UPI0002483FB8|nr:hypothetical protein [Acaryochloris sp. CCMEE 5410]KAI9129867.1 hypothetical protein ON05_032615 [Acaryochloris sp. CCMEE 5410]